MLISYEKRLFIFIISVVYLPVAHATENNPDQNLISQLKSSFVMSLSVGPSRESAGETQTLNLTPDIIKTYTASKPTNTLPSGELFLGIKNALPKQLEGQIGLAFVATGNATLSGDIWDDADPTFDNYTYQYKVSHTAIALKGKLLGSWGLSVSPWISATLGVGFNKAYGFDNTPTIYEAVKTPNFASNTITAFTYAIGMGIQHQLDSHWQIGAGYEFSDWGKSQLALGLSLSHLYTNSVLINLTYL
jgi:hypothetical protein